MLITYGKPRKPVSRNSVGRRIKNELTIVSVDATFFMPHSCRSASVSKTKANGIPKPVILEKGREHIKNNVIIIYKDKINKKIEAAEINYVTPLILE